MDSLDSGRNPICQIATGGGKSIVIASLCTMFDDRILVVTHRKELIRQNEQALRHLGSEETGVVSAGIGRREMDARIVFAGVQTIYRKMDKLQKAGQFSRVIIDECHLIPPPSNKKSMYSQVLNACPDAQRIGMSATPYRLDDGPLWLGNDAWFDDLAYQSGIKPLTEMGYLTPLRGVETAAKVDLDTVRKRQGDYETASLSKALSERRVVELAVDELISVAKDRQSWLLFCVDREHARIVSSELWAKGIDNKIVLGNTASEERDQTLEDFKVGKIRVVVNVGVLTTGFDAPVIDCIGLLRPTLSKSLMVQMLGRGCRLSPETGKEDCLVLDLTGSLAKHLPLDGIPSMAKTRRVIENEERERKEKEEREERERKARHQSRIDVKVDPLGDYSVPEDESERMLVRWVSYKLTRASNRANARNLMVMYRCEGGQIINIWLCPEYTNGSFPRRKAEEWFARRGIRNLAFDADEALKMAQATRMPHHINVQKKDNFWNLLSEEFDTRKGADYESMQFDFELDDVPF